MERGEPSVSKTANTKRTMKKRKIQTMAPRRSYGFFVGVVLTLVLTLEYTSVEVNEAEGQQNEPGNIKES